jgi:hypothetical protein
MQPAKVVISTGWIKTAGKIKNITSRWGRCAIRSFSKSVLKDFDI